MNIPKNCFLELLKEFPKDKKNKFESAMVDPCHAEPGYTLPMQTV